MKLFLVIGIPCDITACVCGAYTTLQAAADAAQRLQDADSSGEWAFNVDMIDSNPHPIDEEFVKALQETTV